MTRKDSKWSTILSDVFKFDYKNIKKLKWKNIFEEHEADIFKN